MITNEIKQKVVEALKKHQKNYSSAAKMAVALGISSAQLSRVLKGEFDGVLSEANWVSLARQLDITLRDADEWKTAETQVYKFIYSQLKACQEQSLSGMLCDIADIGKTYTAVRYAKENKNTVYIDCSQVKTKQKLIRAISKELGLGNTGKYADVYADLVFYLQSLPNPLIILDEAGDLDYPAFLELKALWNATEYTCGWYMMGADGLKEKIESNKGRKKVGYTEIFTRYGSRYQKVTPDGKEAFDEFTKQQVALIAKVNHPAADVQKMYSNTRGSLRRIRTEIKKLKAI